MRALFDTGTGMEGHFEIAHVDAFVLQGLVEINFSSSTSKPLISTILKISPIDTFQ